MDLFIFAVSIFFFASSVTGDDRMLYFVSNCPGDIWLKQQGQSASSVTLLSTSTSLQTAIAASSLHNTSPMYYFKAGCDSTGNACTSNQQETPCPSTPAGCQSTDTAFCVTFGQYNTNADYSSIVASPNNQHTRDFSVSTYAVGTTGPLNPIWYDAKGTLTTFYIEQLPNDANIVITMCAVDGAPQIAPQVQPQITSATSSTTSTTSTPTSTTSSPTSTTSTPTSTTSSPTSTTSSPTSTTSSPTSTTSSPTSTTSSPTSTTSSTTSTTPPSFGTPPTVNPAQPVCPYPAGSDAAVQNCLPICNQPAASSRYMWFTNNCAETDGIWVSCTANAERGLDTTPCGFHIPKTGNYVFQIDDGIGWVGRCHVKSGCGPYGQNCTLGQTDNPCPVDRNGVNLGCPAACNSWAEVNFESIASEQNTFYDISFVDGWTKGVSMIPSTTPQGDCQPLTCNLDITDCPVEDLSQWPIDPSVSTLPNCNYDVKYPNGKMSLTSNDGKYCYAPCKAVTYPCGNYYYNGMGLDQLSQKYMDPARMTCCPNDPSAGAASVSSPECNGLAGPGYKYTGFSVVDTEYVKTIREKCQTAQGKGPYTFAFDDTNANCDCPNSVSLKIEFCPPK